MLAESDQPFCSTHNPKFSRMQPDPMNVSTEQRRLFRYLIPEQPSSSLNRAGREVHLGSGRRSGVIVARAGISGTDAQIPLLAIGFPLVSSSRPSKRPVVKTAYQRPASLGRVPGAPFQCGSCSIARSSTRAEVRHLPGSLHQLVGEHAIIYVISGRTLSLRDTMEKTSSFSNRLLRPS